MALSPGSIDTKDLGIQRKKTLHREVAPSSEKVFYWSFWWFDVKQPEEVSISLPKDFALFKNPYGVSPGSEVPRWRRGMGGSTSWQSKDERGEDEGEKKTISGA